MPCMAQGMRRGPEGTAAWIDLSGKLTERDEEWLKTDVDQGPILLGVTVDVTKLDELTPGGCSTLARLADHLHEQRRLLTVLHCREGPIRDVLQEAGLLDHPGWIQFADAGC